jgi:hypothetical protein
MKKKFTTFVAFVLALAIAFPAVAFARPMDEVTQRVEEGVVYVPLRQAAEVHGWLVYWDRDSNTVFLMNPMGDMEFYDLYDLVELLDGFIENRVTWIPYEFADLIFSAPSITFTLTEEARDIALDDFDFLIEFILTNTPWESVIYRALGFEFLALAAFYRGMIESMEPITIPLYDEAFLRSIFPIHDGGTARELAANYLFIILDGMAFQLEGIGHLMPRMLDMYTAQYIGLIRGLNEPDVTPEVEAYLMHYVGAMMDPAAIWFYGEVEVNLDEPEPIWPAVPGNVQTEIITDEIAYMRIFSFLADSEYDDAIILPFLQEIVDFEHLIIDIRSNTGGAIYYPIQLLFSRLINEPVEVSGREFFSGGEAAYRLMNAMLALVMEEENVLSAEIIPITDFIAEHDLDLFNADDLERLDYVAFSRTVHDPAEDAVGFNGQIWLLVDGWSMSTSVLFASFATETGFATVVGENTSGVMVSAHMYTALPNTGIIWRTDIGYQTDARGRSLEVYGITPDIRNFEGMDALWTVLTIIAEME